MPVQKIEPSQAPQDGADLAKRLKSAPARDEAASEAAHARNGQLTKPPGALGQLEELAIWYCAWRGSPRARIEAPQIALFAGNHGVTAQGVSAFPAEVTAQMVANFAAGGAAINQLAEETGAQLTVRPLSLETPTGDITQGPALEAAGFAEAIEAGWNAVEPNADLLITGEMGIGNTTSAAAISLALFGGTAADWTGRGTGVDDAGLAVKTGAVARAVVANSAARGDPMEILRCLGGRELVAMAAAIARARILCIPVILDGFICTAAAACLHAAAPGALDHAVAGHVSDEKAHGRVLQRIGKEPILSLGLRLGEGSGAAVALPVLRAALACHSGMATFSEAGVAEG